MRLYKKIPSIGLSKLKGINILYENDFYELALLVIKMNEASDKRRGNIESRPTVFGLARIYFDIIGNTGYLDLDDILNIIKKHSLPENMSVDYDQNL
ncbi:hypothetical protein JW964_09555 [candidate division KSB1 bacterium]|nr:hypothetical protein [candidate division KSB1 bacterium]